MRIRKYIQLLIEKLFAPHIIKQSGLFDEDWYVSNYSDVKELHISPLKHFLTIGYKIGYDPSPLFSFERYDTAYPDAKKEYPNLLYHYLYKGKKQGYNIYSAKNPNPKSNIKKYITPFISIIVTSYNYEQFIAETLTSLCKQSYKNFEVIVVDDGSKDNSINVIKQFTEKYKNIKLYTHDNNTNKGIIASILLGLRKAKGDYIAFCESDDYWTTDHLERKVELIQTQDNPSIISNNIELFGDKECVKVRQIYINHINKLLRYGSNKIDIYNNQNMNFIPTLSAVMIKRSILQSLNFESPIPAWIDFWLYRQILKKHTLLYYDGKITFWRQHCSYNGNQVANEFEKKIEIFMSESNKLLDINK